MSEGTTIIRKQTKLGRIYESYNTIPTVFLDGALVVFITLLTFWQNVFGGDEAAKFIPPWLIFYLKNMFGGAAITLVALQSFRSRQFANHMADKEKKQIAADTAATLATHPEGITTQETVTQQITPVLPSADLADKPKP